MNVTPAKSFGLRIEDKIVSVAPAPGTYNVSEADNLLNTSEAYSFGLRPENKISSIAPAPGTYDVEKSDRAMNVIPAKSFGLKIEDKIVSYAPAPGTYNVADADKILNTSESYTFGLRPERKIASISPAPNAYRPEDCMYKCQCHLVPPVVCLLRDNCRLNTNPNPNRQPRLFRITTLRLALLESIYLILVDVAEVTQKHYSDLTVVVFSCYVNVKSRHRGASNCVRDSP